MRVQLHRGPDRDAAVLDECVDLLADPGSFVEGDIGIFLQRGFDVGEIALGAHDQGQGFGIQLVKAKRRGEMRRRHRNHRRIQQAGFHLQRKVRRPFRGNAQFQGRVFGPQALEHIRQAPA
ncbi:hypothetical protein D3C87_1676690 [compost metagenome]